MHEPRVKSAISSESTKQFDGTADSYWTHNGDSGRCSGQGCGSREPHECSENRTGGTSYSNYGHYSTSSCSGGHFGYRTSSTQISKFHITNRRCFYPTTAARSIFHGKTPLRRISISSSFLVQHIERLCGIGPAAIISGRRADGSIMDGTRPICATSGGNCIGNFGYVYHHAGQSLGPNQQLCVN